MKKKRKMLAKQKGRRPRVCAVFAASDIFLSLKRRLVRTAKKHRNRDHSGRNARSSTYPKLTQLGLFTQHYFSHFASFKSDSGWAFVAVSVLLIPEPHEN